MATEIQFLRKINGTPGSPSTVGALEGTIAFNMPGVAGATDKPTMFIFDGVGWREVNPDVPITVGSVSLPGGTVGSATGIGVAWGSLANKPTTSIVIAEYGQTAYVKIGAGGADADWAPLGSATEFASAAEIQAGTETRKAISPAGLASRILVKPDSLNSANNVHKLVMTTTSGKIDNRFLSLPATVQYLGSVNLTLHYKFQNSTLVIGSFCISNTDGTIDATWTAQIENPGTTTSRGDMLFWNGTRWDVIQGDIDPAAFVNVAGVNAIHAGMTMNWTAAANKVVIIDGGDAAFSTISNVNLEDVTIDCGTYP
jgi:hypothetical protein